MAKKKVVANGFVLPLDIVDQICLASLKDHRSYLKSELKNWRKNPKTDDNPTGYWMHPEDVVGNEILIKQMDALIKFYGG